MQYSHSSFLLSFLEELNVNSSILTVRALLIVVITVITDPKFSHPCIGRWAMEETMIQVLQFSLAGVRGQETFNLGSGKLSRHWLIHFPEIFSDPRRLLTLGI